MHSYILLDRSGSMQTRWAEALGSINSYVSGLKDLKGDYNVTVVTFDTNAQWQQPVQLSQLANNVSMNMTINNLPTVQNAATFDIVRNKISVRNWKDLTNEDCTPRGGTPLYDATSRLINLVETDNYDKAVIVIMTDGEENSSQEIRHPQIVKDRLDRMRARGYQVIFLGADFNNTTQSYSLGGQYSNTIQASAANMASTMRSTATKSAEYFTSGTNMSYNAEEKAKALKD